MSQPEQTPTAQQCTSCDHEHQQEAPIAKKKPIRVFMDGCFDVMHSGHYNAIRQAKALGDILVVGVHSDEEITLNKRAPVMNNEQRLALVHACKWVDEVVFDVPYTASRELLEQLDCDYIAHGDDIPVNADGSTIFDTVQDKLRIFRRTPGVSTTHLIQRLLDAVKYHSTPDTLRSPEMMTSTSSWSSFMASASRISAFSNDRMPTEQDKVIYIDGDFDLFHMGHVAALKKAKQLGTFLYVGLYSDEVIAEKKGKFFPLMDLQERVLNVLSCKYVDDVIIGAPWSLSRNMIKILNICKVVSTKNTELSTSPDQSDRFCVAKEMGIYSEIRADTEYNTDMLMKRIVAQQETLETQNQARVQKAKQYSEESGFYCEAPKATESN